MTIAKGRYETLFDLPGSEDEPQSEYGLFSTAIGKITGYTSGGHIYSWTRLGDFLNENGETRFSFDGIKRRNSFDANYYTLVELVEKPDVERVRSLLTKTGLNHINNEGITLCCPTTTQAAQSVFFLNTFGESIVYVASPARLYNLVARAFIDQRTPQDDEFEQRLVERWISRAGERDCGYKFYGSRAQAQAAIDEKVLKYLRECVENPWPSSEDATHDRVYLGAYINGTKYRYPLDLSDSQIAESGDDIVTQVIMAVGSIAHEYPNGKVLVNTQHDRSQSPLDSYFNRRQGILAYRTLGCQNCCPTQNPSLRQKVQDRVKTELWANAYLLDELLGEETEKLRPELGYQFDFNRLRVSVHRERRLFPIRMREIKK